MLTREYEILIHHYLDGELDASTSMRVEEHLRNSPVSQAYFKELKSLDRSLSDALSSFYTDTDTLEQQIIQRLEAQKPELSDTTAPETTPNLANYRKAVRGFKIAAALILVAVGIQIVLLALQKDSRPDGSSLDEAHWQIAQLQKENERLRLLKYRYFPRNNPFLDRTPGLSKAPGPEDVAVPGANDSSTGLKIPDKKEVFQSIQALLLDFQKTGKWDFVRQHKIMQDLAGLEDLTSEDFQALQQLYFQQGDCTMGQIFLAQAISRFCTRHDQARSFVYGKIQDELNRMASGDPSLGDRALRRAWTEGLMNSHDRRNIDYLYRLGSLDRDIDNRGNIMAGLSSIGTSDAALALARLAAGEKLGYLQRDALIQLRDMLYTDPTVSSAIGDELRGMMEQIIRGEFGSDGEYWVSMIWAFKILNQIGFDTDELLRQWRERNKYETGGDPRGANPNGIPIEDDKSHK